METRSPYEVDRQVTIIPGVGARGFVGRGSSTLLERRGPSLSNCEERPFKGISVGTRAQLEMLNNKPTRGLRDFFVRTIDN